MAVPIKPSLFEISWLSPPQRMPTKFPEVEYTGEPLLPP